MTDAWEETGLRFLEEHHRIAWPEDLKELNALVGISEYVMNHLTTQKALSATFEGEEVADCLYRGPNNTMCAVGCLIDDDVMFNVQEGTSASDLVIYPRNNQIVKSIIGKVDQTIDSDNISMLFSNALADVLQFWQFYHDGKDCYAGWLTRGHVDSDDEGRRGMSPRQVHEEVKASISAKLSELGDASVIKSIEAFLSH